MRLLRLAAGLVLGFLLLTLVAVVAIFVFVDPNDFKPVISEQVKQQTGRDLTFKGDISLTLFPRLALELGELELSNAPGFDQTTFAQVKQVSVGVQLIPLLRQELDIGRIRLDGLELNLARRSSGETNWDDLLPETNTTADPSQSPSPTPTTTDPMTTSLAGFSLAGIEITNARFLWQDGDNRYLVDPFDLKTGRIQFSEAIPIELSLKTTLSDPELTTDLKLNSELTVEANLEKFHLNAVTLKLINQGDLFPTQEMTLELSSQIHIDLQQDQLSVPKLKLTSYGLTLNGHAEISQLTETPHYEVTAEIESFNPRELLHTLKLGSEIPVSEPHLTQAQMSVVASGSTDFVTITQLTAQLDQSSLIANAQVKNFSQPAVEFEIDINELDLDPYLVSNQSVEESSPHPAEPSSTASEEILPVELLRDLNIEGALKIGKLKVMNLTTHNLVAKLDAHTGRMALSPLRFDLYSGHFNAHSVVNVQGKQPRILLNQRLTGIQFQPLLQDLLQSESPVSGRGEINMDVSTTGNQLNDWIQRLTGKGAISIQDGALTNINIAHMIRQAEAVLSKQPPPKDSDYQHTDFTALKGQFEFQQGRAVNPNLSMEMPLARVNGQGYLDLTDYYLNYQVNAHLAGTSTGQDGKSLNEVRDIPIPITIEGPIQALKYKLDTDKLLGQKLEQEKAKLKQKAEEEKAKAKAKVDKQIDEKKEEIGKEAEKKLKKQLDKLLNF